MNSFFKKLVTGTAVLALSMTAFASASLAEDTSTSTVITGGTLNYTGITATNFEGIVLNGAIQTVAAQIDAFTITDPSGTGAGWDIAVSASQFNNPLTPTLLSAESLTIAAPTVTEGEGSSVASDIASLGGGIDNNLTTPVTILSADTAEGMGSYSVGAIPMTLTLVPKEVYAGTYTSTITATLTTGP